MRRFTDTRYASVNGKALRGVLKTALVALTFVVALVCQAEFAEAKALKASFALVGEEAAIPYGWVDFCTRQPQECEQPILAAEDLKITAKTWKMLQGVNKDVNAAIVPVTNLEHWGTIADHWDYPTDGKGDCKIFALEKRRQLLEMGVPRQALLMTIVKDHAGMGHAILTVRTDKGDYILDNLTDEILPWNATGYRFVKRQSQEDPNVWLAILSPAKVSAR
jgi:predicted transglutaminase-like cysteine proteinase